MPGKNQRPSFTRKYVKPSSVEDLAQSSPQPSHLPPNSSPTALSPTGAGWDLGWRLAGRSLRPWFWLPLGSVRAPPRGGSIIGINICCGFIREIRRNHATGREKPLESSGIFRNFLEFGCSGLFLLSVAIFLLAGFADVPESSGIWLPALFPERRVPLSYGKLWGIHFRMVFVDDDLAGCSRLGHTISFGL